MKSTRWKIHAIFTCLDCGSKFQNYKNAEKLANRHATKLKHKVTGEVGFAVKYNGRDEDN